MVERTIHKGADRMSELSATAYGQLKEKAAGNEKTKSDH